MRIYILASIASLSVMMVNSAYADPGCCKPATNCCSPCTSCSKILTCCPTTEVVKVEKKCYDIECDYICVPEVKCPWGKLLSLGCLGHDKKSDCCSTCDSCGSGQECDCAGLCGKIKKINKLKTVKTKTEKVVWKWEVKERGPIGCCKPDCAAPSFNY